MQYCTTCCNSHSELRLPVLWFAAHRSPLTGTAPRERKTKTRFLPRQTTKKLIKRRFNSFKKCYSKLYALNDEFIYELFTHSFIHVWDSEKYFMCSNSGLSKTLLSTGQRWFSTKVIQNWSTKLHCILFKLAMRYTTDWNWWKPADFESLDLCFLLLASQILSDAGWSIFYALRKSTKENKLEAAKWITKALAKVLA